MTGSSSGIGLAIAKGLAAAGARVAIHGRDAERVKTALADVAGAVAVRFDVTDEAGVAAGIAEAEAASAASTSSSTTLACSSAVP